MNIVPTSVRSPLQKKLPPKALKMPIPQYNYQLSYPLKL